MKKPNVTRSKEPGIKIKFRKDLKFIDLDVIPWCNGKIREIEEAYKKRMKK